MGVITRTFDYMNTKTWWILFWGIVTSILQAVFALAAPKVVENIVNRVFYGEDFNIMISLLAIYIAVYFCMSTCRFLQQYLNTYISQTIIYGLRSELYRTIQKQSIDFFDRVETGQLISRGTSDIRAVNGLMRESLRLFIRAIVSYIGIFVLIGIVDWTLMLVVLLIALILFAVMFYYLKRVNPLFRVIREKYGDLNSVLSENIYGAPVVRAFNAEKIEMDKFHKNNLDYYILNKELTRLQAIFTALFPFLLGIGSFFLLFLGGRMVINGEILVGTLIAVNIYLLFLGVPTRFLSLAILQYQEGFASLKRLYEIYDMEKCIVEKQEAIDLPAVKGEIVFDNVKFAYVEGEQLVLDNVSLQINPGETIAFLGTTGSGKSTLVSLVPRFYDPQEGAVLIDGFNIQDVTLSSLRKQIAVVQQEAFLFAKSIRENIAFGKPDSTNEEIIRVAKIAQAHEFIMNLPDDYETILAERGTNLSGGQRQRLTIARALLLNNPILIMDDSSSALDFETEHQFQKAVCELIKNKTTLIVTQRLSTIKFATKIVVMDKGKTVELGAHDELIAKSGLYKRLYETQLVNHNQISVGNEVEEKVAVLPIESTLIEKQARKKTEKKRNEG
ncbi:MAG: ABC transporter ATP-binding protein [Asgard group archaeon]|nr:ABC transporter ATP-binding protein [Asgard group archaeon]